MRQAGGGVSPRSLFEESNSYIQHCT